MSNTKPSTQSTTPTAVARIQSAVAIQNGGQIPKGSYVGRMQRAVAQPQSANRSKNK